VLEEGDSLPYCPTAGKVLTVGEAASAYPPEKLPVALPAWTPRRIIVRHNHQAVPGERRSLLLVKYGTLTIAVCYVKERLLVYASGSKPGRGEWTKRAIHANSVEHARQIVRGLVRKLGP
jgi:hypothetical protein